MACFVSGDRAYFKNCRFLGNQDTLYTYGKDSRQFYDHCYIEGTVDFIFGWSTALFKDCTIIAWVMVMLPLLLQIKARNMVMFLLAVN